MKIHEDFLVELSSPLHFIFTIGWWIEHRLHCKAVWVPNVSWSRISVYLCWLINKKNICIGLYICLCI